MNVVGKHILIPQMILQGDNRDRQSERHFFSPENIPQQQQLAVQYAEVKGDDFLIVAVTHMICIKNIPSPVGKLLLINKHVKGKDGRLRRRLFFEEMYLEEQIKLGNRYAHENKVNYLICQIMSEISASAAAKARVRRPGKV